MNLKPVVSVILPFYNVENYLDACLASIARSSVADLEVLLVDDGSHDASASIASGYASRDRRFRLFSQPNRGNGASRNSALLQARGEVIAFADGDDIVPPDAYAVLLQALRNNNVDIAAGRVVRINDNGKPGRSSIHDRALKTPAARTRLAIQPELFGDTCLWNKLYTRNFFMQQVYPIPESCLYEDLLAVTRAYTAARSVSIVPETVYQWRKRGDGSSITQGMHRISTMSDRYRMLRQARTLVHETAPELLTAFDSKCLAIDLPITFKQRNCSNHLYRSVAFCNIAELLSDGYTRIEGPHASAHRIANLLADRDFHQASVVLEQSWRTLPVWGTVQSCTAKARELVSDLLTGMPGFLTEPRFGR
jgi:Glycosyl transferase family 2